MQRPRPIGLGVRLPQFELPREGSFSGYLRGADRAVVLCPLPLGGLDTAAKAVPVMSLSGALETPDPKPACHNHSGQAIDRQG